VPVVLGVLIAVGAGIGISALVLRLIGGGQIPFLLDGPFIGPSRPRPLCWFSP
jgi:hypothetical protein